MSLIDYGTGPADGPATDIPNNSFWPAINPDAFRAATRTDSSVTNERAVFALQAAVADVNRQLADFQAEQEKSGAATIDDLTPPGWAAPDHYNTLYRRAIYATAKASLLERYRDFSATPDGDAKGEAKDNAADDYRADARWAVAEIVGRGHTTVELI